MFIFTPILQRMYKYKYFLVFLCAIATLLFCLFFPICFDNNDDQVMYAICTGIISGVASPNLILTNILTGRVLCALFEFSNKINWYTLYLEGSLFCCFLFFCLLMIKDKATNFLTSVMLVLILFLGFFSLSMVKLQFTTVALFCAFAALFSLKMEIKLVRKLGLVFFFLLVSMLIRKEGFYIFILFSFPIVIANFRINYFLRDYFISLILSVMIFGVTCFINNNNVVYQQQATYSNINALDIIAAKPVKINTETLHKYQFTQSDITLLQSWMMADNAYLTGKHIEQLAIELKAIRNSTEFLKEFIKFVSDERYLLLFYFLSSFLLFVFVYSSRKIVLLNLLVFLFFLFYLIFTSRIPHRVSFPVLTYLVLLNIYLLIQSKTDNAFKIRILVLFLILSTYKYYCTAKLISVQQEYHRVFTACQQEINSHPEYLFIASEGFPLQFMNAWQTPQTDFPSRNVILTAWYGCSPDYQVLLKTHHLKNLSSDLKNKKNVVFLTSSTLLQQSYIQVMWERYNIKCHFEPVTKGFTELHPKLLVFDN